MAGHRRPVGEAWQRLQAHRKLTCCVTAFQGVEYWRAERDICRRLSKSACSLTGHAEPCVSADEIHAATQSKSFDYRVRYYGVASFRAHTSSKIGRALHRDARSLRRI